LINGFLPVIQNECISTFFINRVAEVLQNEAKDLFPVCFRCDQLSEVAISDLPARNGVPSPNWDFWHSIVKAVRTLDLDTKPNVLG